MKLSITIYSFAVMLFNSFKYHACTEGPHIIYSVAITPLKWKPASPTANLMSLHVDAHRDLKTHMPKTEFSIAFTILAYSNSILLIFQAKTLDINKFWGPYLLQKSRIQPLLTTCTTKTLFHNTLWQRLLATHLIHGLLFFLDRHFPASLAVS